MSARVREALRQLHEASSRLSFCLQLQSDSRNLPPVAYGPELAELTREVQGQWDSHVAKARAVLDEKTNAYMEAVAADTGKA